MAQPVVAAAPRQANQLMQLNDSSGDRNVKDTNALILRPCVDLFSSSVFVLFSHGNSFFYFYHMLDLLGLGFGQLSNARFFCNLRVSYLNAYSSTVSSLQVLDVGECDAPICVRLRQRYLSPLHCSIVKHAYKYAGKSILRYPEKLTKVLTVCIIGTG